MSSSGAAVAAPPAAAAGILTLGYIETIDDQIGIAAGPTDLIALERTVTVAAARYIMITGHGRLAATGSCQFLVRVMEGATTVGDIWVGTFDAGGDRSFMDGSVILTAPPAGPHTYKLQAVRVSGAATLSVESQVASPSYLRVEDLGPV